MRSRGLSAKLAASTSAATGYPPSVLTKLWAMVSAPAGVSGEIGGSVCEAQCGIIGAITDVLPLNVGATAISWRASVEETQGCSSAPPF
ncbi:MAG TPA: hypothetical protein VK930_02105 [Verrucomicrobiae bacterium]|nr:hypothetical protein [Verrucomicrobiae bacterium]